MRRDLTVEKTRYSRQRDRSVGKSHAKPEFCFGECGDILQSGREVVRTEAPGDGATEEIRDRRKSLISWRRPCLLQLPVQRGRK